MYESRYEQSDAMHGGLYLPHDYKYASNRVLIERATVNIAATLVMEGFQATKGVT